MDQLIIFGMFLTFCVTIIALVTLGDSKKEAKRMGKVLKNLTLVILRLLEK